MVGVAGEGVVRIKASSLCLPTAGAGVSADTLLGEQLTARFQLPVSLYCCFTVCTVSYIIYSYSITSNGYYIEFCTYK